MRAKRKVVFAVGGTGGHLFPAQALARDVKDKFPQTQVLFMGAGLSSSRFFFTREFPSINVESSTVFDKGLRNIFCAVGLLFKGIWKSWNHLRKENPDLVIGFGSFHAFPVLMAALLHNIPIVLFESNVVPGRVIRFFSRFSVFTAVQFRKAKEYLKGKVVEAKMPLWDRDRLSEFTREEAAKYFSLRPDETTLLVFGGSQGARAINKLFCEAMHHWQKRPFFQVIHLTGDVTSCQEALLCYKRLGIPAQVKVFEDRMPLAWRLCDLAICRSGASTIAELLAHRVPALLIPYPHASDDHQMHNAQNFSEEVKSAIVLPEHQLRWQELQMTLNGLLKDQASGLKQMREAFLQFEENSTRAALFSLLERWL